jgi:hypothetical protein
MIEWEQAMYEETRLMPEVFPKLKASAAVSYANCDNERDSPLQVGKPGSLPRLSAGRARC